MATIIKPLAEQIEYFEKSAMFARSYAVVLGTLLRVCSQSTPQNPIDIEAFVRVNRPDWKMIHPVGFIAQPGTNTYRIDYGEWIYPF